MNPEQVFDSFLKFSDEVHRLDRARRLRADLAKAELRQCGNCDHWMKSRLCPIDDQRKGFPSHNYPGCAKFTQSAWAAKRVEELRAAVNGEVTR